MKAYLLGTLRDREADQFEERYFVDPAYLRYVREVEDQLIRDYLAGQLPDADRVCFESRYRTVPELIKRLEEVGAAPPPPRPAGRTWILATGICLVICVAAVTLLMRVRPGRSPAAVRPIPGAVVLTIRLVPGQAKGAGAGVSFTRPSVGSVDLILELPGRRQPFSGRVVLGTVGPDGRFRPVWTSPRLTAEPGITGEQVSVEVDTSVLTPEDYLSRIVDDSGETLETYSFRVIGAP